MSALANLSTSLTINGVTKTPNLFLVGQDASATDWNSLAGGANLAIAGAGTLPTLQQQIPTVSSDDYGVLFASGQKYYAAAASSVCEIGTSDMVIEWVMRSDTTSTKNIFHSRSGTGYSLRTTAGEYQLYMTGASGSLVLASTGGRAGLGLWNHLMIFLDYSGRAALYINGAYEAVTTADISTLGAIANGIAPTCCNSYVGCLAQLAVWQGAAWLDTHLQAAVAVARSKALFGANTDETRDSLAYLHKPVGGAKKYFLVGKNWMRLSQDVGGSPAYQKEAAATTLVADSNTYSATTGITTTVDAVSPFDGELATVFVEDGLTSGHFSQQTTGVAAATTQYVLTVFAKASGRDVFRAQSSSLTNFPCRGTFKLSGAGSVIDLIDGDSSSIELIGDGWYKCQIICTSTVGGSFNMRFYLSSDDTPTLSYAGNSSPAMEFIHTTIETGSADTSPILSTGSYGTRLADA